MKSNIIGIVGALIILVALLAGCTSNWNINDTQEKKLANVKPIAEKWFEANMPDVKDISEMVIETERLLLGKWTEDDAESLFTYAKNPNVVPIARWPPHKDIESSRYVIDNVFCEAECYAICEKENNIAIGAIKL